MDVDASTYHKQAHHAQSPWVIVCLYCSPLMKLFHDYLWRRVWGFRKTFFGAVCFYSNILLWFILPSSEPPHAHPFYTGVIMGLDCTLCVSVMWGLFLLYSVIHWSISSVSCCTLSLQLRQKTHRTSFSFMRLFVSSLHVTFSCPWAWGCAPNTLPSFNAHNTVPVLTFHTLTSGRCATAQLVCTEPFSFILLSHATLIDTSIVQCDKKKSVLRSKIFCLFRHVHSISTANLTYQPSHH